MHKRDNAKIEHVVVLMNMYFDNLSEWLYDKGNNPLYKG